MSNYINCKYYDSNTKPVELIDDTLIKCNHYERYQKVKKECENCSVKHGKLYALWFKGVLNPTVDTASYDKNEIINLYNERIGEDKQFENLYSIKEYEEVE